MIGVGVDKTAPVGNKINSLNLELLRWKAIDAD